MAQAGSFSARLRQIFRLPIAAVFILATFPVSLPLLWAFRRRHGHFPYLSVADLFAAPRRRRAKSAVRYLWAGREAEARATLEQMIARATRLDSPTAIAVQGLVARHVFAERLDAAGATLETPAARAAGDPRHMRTIANLRCQILAAQGNFDAAARAFDDLAPRQLDANAQLALVNAHPAPGARLAQLNRVLSQAGLAEITMRDPGQDAGLDNITVADAGADCAGMGKVSIIFPVFNAGVSLRTAVESILVQTYRDLEILLVDDCSTDDTPAVMHALAARDPRVRVIACETNGGAYRARNAGAAVATGAYLTTHDADDWSHPAKIEIQVRAFHRDPVLAATGSHWVRATPDLVLGAWRLSDRLLHINYSSLMVRREVFDRIGPWDPVRVSGDLEYLNRLRDAVGRRAVRWLRRDAPLALGRAGAESLTQMKATHVSTAFLGLRFHYHEAFRYLLATGRGQGKEGAALRRALSPREIFDREVPVHPVAKRLVGDCRDASIVGQMAEIVSRTPGEIAITHHPDYVLSRESHPHPDFFDLIRKPQVWIACIPENYPAEEVVCLSRD